MSLCCGRGPILGISEGPECGLRAKMLIFRIGAACISGEMLALGCQWSIKDHLSEAVVSNKEIRCHKKQF